MEGLLKPYLREDILIEENGKDPTGSGLEYRRIIALLKEGKTREQIFKKMEQYTKWATHGKKNPKYRKDTYEKALKYVDEIEPKQKQPDLSEEELKITLKPIYNKIIKILKKYLDLEEENYLLITTWIIGTYFHNSFRSYPYLFFNAMKGSGKSRALNLITLLSKDGIVLNSLTEAVLFRTTGTLGIDEFEGIEKKGNENLRELLNSAYKKTGKVFRMKKVSGKNGETQEVEKFDVYRPIIMANIWGMEETLGDRCIQIILEKSVNKKIVKLIEDFEQNFQIMEVLDLVSKGIGSYGSFGALQTIQQNWNNFIENVNTPTPLNTSITSIPSIPSITSITSILYNKINNTQLLGRDLELFFPLFLIGNLCGKLDEMLKISIRIVKERKEKDIYESMDVQVYDFISQYRNTSFVRVSDLTSQFRVFIGTQEKEDSWINTRWFGKSIKRLKLDKEKKRSNGMLVILNIDKAKEKIKMFREVEEPEEELKTEKNKMKKVNYKEFKDTQLKETLEEMIMRKMQTSNRKFINRKERPEKFSIFKREIARIKTEITRRENENST